MAPSLCVLAAGMGTRYGGLKQIDPVGPHGETILDYSIYDALRAGFSRVVFVIRRDIEEAFRDAIGRRFEALTDVAYAFQSLDQVPVGVTPPPDRTKPWGTAHAVWAARSVIDEPFTVINADDFYGSSAYRSMAGFLGTVPAGGCNHYAMVGFQLHNTLSDHGHVARGICLVDDQGALQQIEEHTKILKRGNHAVSLGHDDQEMLLTGNEWVSMNCWGFTPTVFPQLGTYFARFLQAYAADPKAEFFIPLLIESLIKEGNADVRVLPSHDAWFGVTYREDKPAVTAAIADLSAQGAYPAPLWPVP